MTMLRGIDVSRHQGTVDWRRAWDASVRFAWIKATEGADWVDPQMNANAANALAAGILAGPYHYWRKQWPAADQVAHFRRATSGHDWTLPPAVDFEETGNEGVIDPVAVRAVLEAVTAAFGIRPFVYTSAGWWRANMPGGQPWAADYPLWVASWTTARRPTLPRDWSTWTIWQHGGGPGSQYGVRSQTVDLNAFAGTVEDLAAFLQPVEAPVRFDKVVWLLEEAQRRAEDEGLIAESAWVGRNYTADAIQRRDRHGQGR